MMIDKSEALNPLTYKMKTKRLRLDQAMLEKGLVQSRAKAQGLIAAGMVRVNDKLVDKAGFQTIVSDSIAIIEQICPYVSRGGLKLEKALSHFQIDPSGKVCMDIGASTGGFTDCLLKKGALKVYAIDVGKGQLDWGLRNDSRVVSFEKTNIRLLETDAIQDKFDLISIDVSFISLKLVMPHAIRFLGAYGEIIALVKPQFEVGKGKVGKGGIVRDESLHNEVVDELVNTFSKIGLVTNGIIPSPILGAKGNKEYLLHLVSQKDKKIFDTNRLVIV